MAKERRLIWKDHWFVKPDKSLSRDEQRARHALARQEKGQRRREDFNRVEEERKRVSVLLYEDSLIAKRLNDQKLQETLEEQMRRSTKGGRTQTHQLISCVLVWWVMDLAWTQQLIGNLLTLLTIDALHILPQLCFFHLLLILLVNYQT